MKIFFLTIIITLSLQLISLMGLTVFGLGHTLGAW